MFERRFRTWRQGFAQLPFVVRYLRLLLTVTSGYGAGAPPPGGAFYPRPLGKPDLKAGRLELWQRRLRQLVALPNVACKLSGLTTEADRHWTPADLNPYIDILLETFGSERVMFGSDWPVLRLATTYARWWDVCEAYLTDLTPSEQRNVWCETARRWYRLDGSPAQLERIF